MAHTEKNDKHAMEETEDRAAKERPKDFLKIGRRVSRASRKTAYDSKAKKDQPLHPHRRIPLLLLLTHCLLSTAIAVLALTIVPHKEFQSLLFSFKFLLLSDINFLHCTQ